MLVLLFFEVSLHELGEGLSCSPALSEYWFRAEDMARLMLQKIHHSHSSVLFSTHSVRAVAAFPIHVDSLKRVISSRLVGSSKV
jgi:hypothetical protein